MSSPVFARHETFHPRYSWLKKGFDEGSKDGHIFSDSRANVRLGVGKNMVRSIRYWCHAFKVLEDDPEAPGRARVCRTTAFGERLLGSDGLDPYLEDLGSLWLLHWNLLQEPCRATAWRYAFFVHARPELSAAELTNGLQEYLTKEYPGTRVATSSLKKDANCILRMYGDISGKRTISEDSIHSPFAELGLLRPSDAAKTYAFRMGAKPGLTDELLTSISLGYAATHYQGRQTIALSKLLHGPESPGLAFKLTESALYGALENVVRSEPALGLADTAGVSQLSFTKKPDRLATEMLDRHFRHAVGQEAVA